MIVIDASVAIEILVRTPISTNVAARVVYEDVHAPHLIDLEVTSALRRMVKANALDVVTAEAALTGMQEWPLVRHEHTLLLNRIWELRESVSAYDACYVALAETLNAPLFTFDGRLSRSHGHRATIEMLG